MASTYIHVGDIDSIAEDAPPALLFVKSYVPALDSTSHSARAAHFSSTATIRTNADPPIPFTSLAPLFEARAKMALRFSHTVNRVWVISPPVAEPATGEGEGEGNKITVLMDWTSTTVFKGAEDTAAVVPEFTVLTLGKVKEGKGEESERKGVHGLWVEMVENWMDVGPVKELRAKLHGEIAKG